MQSVQNNDQYKMTFNLSINFGLIPFKFKVLKWIKIALKSCFWN